MKLSVEVLLWVAWTLIAKNKCLHAHVSRLSVMKARSSSLGTDNMHDLFWLLSEWIECYIPIHSSRNARAHFLKLSALHSSAAIREQAQEWAVNMMFVCLFCPLQMCVTEAFWNSMVYCRQRDTQMLKEMREETRTMTGPWKRDRMLRKRWRHCYWKKRLQSLKSKHKKPKRQKVAGKEERESLLTKGWPLKILRIVHQTQNGLSQEIASKLLFKACHTWRLPKDMKIKPFTVNILNQASRAKLDS